MFKADENKTEEGRVAFYGKRNLEENKQTNIKSQNMITKGMILQSSSSYTSKIRPSEVEFFIANIV